MTFFLKEARKKVAFLGDASVKGGDLSPLKNASFFSIYKKSLEYSEAKEYAKIFYEIFARVSIKNIFYNIFIYKIY